MREDDMAGDCVYGFDGRCLRGRPMGCGTCKERLEAGDPRTPSAWEDPLEVISRDRMPAGVLRNALAGGSAFLFCGGPSANGMPLELLGRRGCWTLAVNNAAGHPRVRPQAFVCSDPPEKFSHSVWLDPAVMKFVPTAKLSGYRANLRGKREGRFYRLDRQTNACPNVWGFKRWSWLHPDDRFFTSDGACWGNNDRGSRDTGQPKTVCTMLLGIRLLRWLGARRVYLVGVDFRMTPDAGYSFAERRDEGACRSNNALYATVNEWLVQMQTGGTFARFGMEIFNCYDRSGLRAFPHVPLEEAVAEACGAVEAVPDLADWYSPR